MAVDEKLSLTVTVNKKYNWQMLSVQLRMGVAVRQVDSELVQATSRYPGALPATHRAALQGWSSRLRWVGGVLAAYDPEEFVQLGPLAKQLEVFRAYAEALLALAKTGERQLTDAQRERLTQRALGIVPSEEGERFVEIGACPELAPHYLTSSPERFVSGITQIDEELGRATALGYGCLLMSGVRSGADLMKYGMRIEMFFDAIVARAGIRPQLEALKSDGLKRLGDDRRVELLRRVHAALWEERPNRLGSSFLLTQVVDGCLGLRPGGVGDALGLAVIDSIIVGKLGFGVRQLVRGERMFLKIMAGGRTLEYWDPCDRTGRVPVASARELGLIDLLVMGYCRLARGYVNLRSFGHGMRVAHWILGMKPDSAEAQEIMGQCLLGEGNPREALAACERALALDPRRAETYLVRGNAYAALERWPEAIAQYKEAIHHRVGFAEAYNNLGLALARNGEAERALGAYKQAIRIRPDYADAWFNIGNLHMEQADYDAAITAYQKAVAAAPDFAAAYYNLGQAYYAKKELEPALAAYRCAVQVNPKHAGAWHNIGIVYRDLGQTELAVQAIEKAVQLNPTLLR